MQRHEFKYSWVPIDRLLAICVYSKTINEATTQIWKTNKDILGSKMRNAFCMRERTSRKEKKIREKCEL